MPKVSIVLPSYNGERFIRASIDSILGQTYQDWELIIVNDCSSDHTLQIAREYEIPSNQAVIDGNEKAALETMKEVYLAKVSVREGNGNRRLAFATESLCVSTKEFSTYLPMCLEILDLAEDRQREHIAEMRNRQEERPKRIGYIHPDGTIR